MPWERDFEGIPLVGKHTVYSFLFSINKKNYSYETMCDKELTAQRRYGRYLKKFSNKEQVELIDFWKWAWEDGELNDEETKLIYHIRGLYEE